MSKQNREQYNWNFKKRPIQNFMIGSMHKQIYPNRYTFLHFVIGTE